MANRATTPLSVTGACCLRPAGDWLQGPYVYALYQHYGFDRGDIGRLFIAGFGSSMIIGTVIGSLADKSCDLCHRHASSASLNGKALLELHDWVSSSSADVQIEPAVAFLQRHVVGPT